MMRWAWAKSVAAGLACAGFVAGQAPPARVSVSPPAHSSPPEAKDGPREGDVIALPTAGQPERKVKVLRVTRSDGGEAMADLQDQATGARYTVPARVLTAKPRPTAPPARSGLLHNPTRWNKSARPSATPAARPQYAAPHPTPKTVTYKPPVPPRPAPKEERPVPRAESPSQTIVTRPPAPAAAPVPSPPVTPLPYERPSPAPVAPPSLIVFPSTTAFAPTAPAVVAPPIPEVRPAGLFVPLPPQLTPPIPDADPMADETEPYLRDLFGALRPSVRERAATALAECRYGSRPETKAQLVKAATSDPSPDVRAHCVRLLSKLGYHESRYLDELAGWAESGPPPLKQAARDALARLTAKN